jgi:uncharacterized phage protein (TIGR01671 family)
MEDRFKFRVKFEQDGKVKMFNVSALHQLENGYMIDFKRHSSETCNIGSGVKGVELMQCTGFKDKNGTLTFWGDIVKDKLGRIYIIEPCAGAFHLQQIKLYKDGGYNRTTCYNYTMYSEKDFEIIGNIYENKELLNERK